jgi:hypothetical protein
MKNLTVLFLLAISTNTDAQYYYKDILGTKEANDMMQKMVAAKVKSVLATSFDPDGSKTENFFVQQHVSRNPYTLTTITRTGLSENSTLISYFDDQIRIIKTTDSSGSMANFSTYAYDAEGNLTVVKTWTVDSTGATVSQEQHDWSYVKGIVQKMVRTKNGVKVDEHWFALDDAGNVEEEQTYRNNKRDITFYFYNDKNQLTDIATRYVEAVKQVVPDYMFEYSTAGQVIQKITVSSNSSDYIIWRYQYDARGIKTKEAFYNRYKDLLGRVEYQYGYWE